VESIRFIVYSDYLCPWCFNASVRLHRLRDEFEGRVELDWRSFLLRPEPDPNRSLEKFREYTRSWMRPGAEEDGGSFRVWETDEGPPSHSVPPHLVAKAAATLGPDAFERMHDRLLRAYFTENHDVTHPETLRTLWKELGFPDEAFARADDPALLRRVLEEHNEALGCGAGGVPAVRLDGNDAVITGAHPYELYRRWAERALQRVQAGE
jgi:predicted DsbA family dithiol-disulfide isomerase